MYEQTLFISGSVILVKENTHLPVLFVKKVLKLIIFIIMTNFHLHESLTNMTTSYLLINEFQVAMELVLLFVVLLRTFANTELPISLYSLHEILCFQPIDSLNYIHLFICHKLSHSDYL